ncbi:MAG TPA: hypothetical protein VGL56_02480 [Fimbriimonadaceae bacterium]
MPLLIFSLLATAFCVWMWKKSVIRGTGEGAEASISRAVASAFWITAVMVVSFLTLQLFARELAVWCGYAGKPF